MSETPALYAATRAGGMRFYREIKEVRAFPSNAIKFLVAVSRWQGDTEIERAFLLAETEQDAERLFRIWSNDRIMRYAKRAEDADARLAWRWKIQKAKGARNGLDC